MFPICNKTISFSRKDKLHIRQMPVEYDSKQARLAMKGLEVPHFQRPDRYEKTLNLTQKPFCPAERCLRAPKITFFRAKMVFCGLNKCLYVTNKTFCAPIKRLYVTQKSFCVPTKCLSAAQKAFRIPIKCLCATQKTFCATQKCLCVTQKVVSASEKVIKMVLERAFMYRIKTVPERADEAPGKFCFRHGNVSINWRGASA